MSAVALLMTGCADAIPQLTSLLSSKAQPSGLQYAVLKETSTQTIVAPQSTVGFSKISYTIDIDEASVESYRYQLVEASSACPSVASGTVVSVDSGFSTSVMPTVISFRLCLWVTTKSGIAPALVDSLSEQEWSISPQVKVIGVHGSDGAFGLGSLLNLTLRFSGPVQLQSGSPRLDLSISGREALFLSAAGSDLLFNYTVAAGDLSNDLDVDFVNLNGASIVDSFGETVDISIPAGSSLASLYNTQIDAVPPLTPTLALAGGMLNPSSNVNPEFVASNLTAGEYLWFIKGTCSDAITATWTASGPTQTIAWTQAFGTLPQGVTSFVVKAVDMAGNSTCSSPYNYNLDTTPYLTISSSPSSYVGMMNSTPRQIQITVRDINGLSMDDFTSDISNVAQFFRGGVDAGCNIISESGSGGVRSLSVAQCQGDGNIDLTLPAGAVVSSRGVASSLAQQSAVLIADNTGPATTVSWSNYVSPFFDTDRSSPTLQWSAPTDIGSGVENIYVSAGTSGGGVDIYGWTPTGGSFATFNPGDFLFGNRYYMNLKAVDYAGNVSNTYDLMWRHHCRAVGFCNQAFLKSVNSITNEFTQESFAGTVVKQSGNYLAVGAPRKKVSGYADAGAIYFYELRFNGWFKVGELVNPSPNENRFFGRSLAFDDDKLIVGAPGDGTYPGAVFLYKFISGSWVQKSRTNYNLAFLGLGGAQGQPGDLFGHALDYSPSTSRLVVGSPGSIQYGRADLIQVDWANYTLSWQTGYTGLGPTLINVGTSVAISSDGSVAAASARRIGVVGHLYIFSNMGNWSNPIQKSDAALDTGFGNSVSISAAGGRIAVGAPLSDKVYVYERGGGDFSMTPVVLGIQYDHSGFDDRLGDAVLLSPNGSQLYIGATQSRITTATGPYVAPSFGSTPVGAVYEYEFDGSVWAPKSHFRSSGAAHASQFGYALALKPNGGILQGNLLFVGAPEDNTVAQVINSSIIPSGISGPPEYYKAGAVHVFASEPEN